MTAKLHVVGVRHHSPACARLVETTIRRTKPRFVLIEGPSDMNERLGELLLEHRLPIALFTYRQNAGGSSGTWSPFCDYSPEWIALRAAAEVGATALFVDLPAWHTAFDGEENRYSDRHVRHSERLHELCAELGFEDTDALWDHLFEQPGPGEDALAARLADYFAMLRGDEPGGPRDDPREDFMARHVAWAMAEGGDVVFVCGGYHKPAIERIWSCVPAERPAVAAPEGVRVGSYLVPFSFRRLDSFAGYASGMPSPAFYQTVWHEGHARAGEAMMFAAIAHLRAKKQRVSAADAIAAATLAHGLRALRGHAALARVDVLDGLAGALVKDALEAPLPWTRRGVLAPRTDPLLVEIVAAFSGQNVGELAPGTPQPPLVHDAFAELERVGIVPTRDVQRLRVQLSGGAGAHGAHGASEATGSHGVAQSSVLHRLRVLGVPGFALGRGPSLSRTQTDLSEEWTVVRRLETDPALIEAALYGATLEGAAIAKLEERGRDAANVSDLAGVLVDAALSGLAAFTRQGLADMARVIAAEPSFAALGGALAKLLALRRGDVVLGERARLELDDVLAACFDRGLWLYEGIRGASAALDVAQVGAVRALRDTLRVSGLALDAERAHGVCERRARDPEAPPALRGAALGFLWSVRDSDETGEHAEREEAAALAILGSVARPTAMGDFLGGLFALAREEVVRARRLVLAIDAALEAFGREDFLAALPALRQAFAYFPPRERLSIAEAILARDGAKADPMTVLGATVNPAAVQRAAALERAAATLASRFGLHDVFDARDSHDEGAP